MLILQRKCGESIIIDDTIEIRITEISGDKVKVGIEAPISVGVYRKEIYQTVQSNKQAAKMPNHSDLAQLAAAVRQREGKMD